jgi:hypothetical protein
LDELTINPRRGENATDRVPEPIIGPLLAWAVRWVNDFSDDLLTAHAEWLRLHAHTHNNRQRRGEARVPDIPGRLRTLLNRYRQEQRPLPLGDKGVNRTHLAREIGCAHGPLFGVTCGRIIDEAAAELGINDGTYLRTPINARLDGPRAVGTRNGGARQHVHHRCVRDRRVRPAGHRPVVSGRAHRRGRPLRRCQRRAAARHGGDRGAAAERRPDPLRHRRGPLGPGAENRWRPPRGRRSLFAIVGVVLADVVQSIGAALIVIGAVWIAWAARRRPVEDAARRLLA